jgi:hypothetical protein
VLFVNGPAKGEKFRLEPSLENKGKSGFTIGRNNCDINISNNEEISALICFKFNYGWTLSLNSA